MNNATQDLLLYTGPAGHSIKSPRHTHTHAHDRPRLMQHQRVEFHVSYFATDSHVTQQAVDSEERSRINTAFGDGTVSA